MSFMLFFILPIFFKIKVFDCGALDDTSSFITERAIHVGYESMVVITGFLASPVKEAGLGLQYSIHIEIGSTDELKLFVYDEFRKCIHLQTCASTRLSFRFRWYHFKTSF